MSTRETLRSPGRRRIIKSGAITVGFTLMPAGLALAQDKSGVTEAMPTGTPGPKLKLPGSLSTTPMLDAWIKIDQTGKVTVFTGKAELGTGVRTAMSQVAAEQLDLPFEAVHLVTADTAITPNEGYTAGSHTMADSGTAILNAAAQVRTLLAQAAAQRLGVDVTALKFERGVISTADGRKISYGEAVQGLDLHRPAQADSQIKDPRTHRVIGRPVRRLDIPGKVTGGQSYVQDLRLPGMVHGRVVRPPSYGATLVKFDPAAVEAMPGVVKVVRDGNYLAVVAQDEWQAIQAARALAAAVSWHEVDNMPAPADVYATLLKLPAQEIKVIDQKRAAAPAAQTLHARYTKPYLVHGSIGPSCAVAHLDGDKLTVWSHTQGVFPLRGGLAEMLGMPPANVRCIHVEGSGCYGHNGADDVAADAALMARAVPGKPVRVQWMREDEHVFEPHSPAMVTDVKASLDANGNIVDWLYEIWSNSHNQRIDNAGRLMPTWFLAKPFIPAPPKPIPMPEGGGDRNSIPLYDIPNMQVQHHFLPDMPVRVSAMRGLGAYANVFTIESFMDELAVAAKVDPVEFRLRHLQNDRGRAVVALAADRFGWRSHAKRPPGRGIGFSFAQYKNLMSYMAIALELTVDRDSGEVRIERVVAAVDCGEIVNPDGVRNQIEGGILQSASWTLYEQLRFDKRHVKSYDWSTYPIMRFSQVPGAVEVHLIDRPGAPFLGAGEASQGPSSAAVANAIFDATGLRLRDLPIGGNGLRQALNA
jgi:CO/xanthine dehydrogenase Mo-binding subunit